ncbi:MAG: ferritin-like domain-containing protein [Janthinobacterium lividum]
MSLKEVLIDEMRDLYSAENQIVKALPKALKEVSDEKLKQAMTAHLEETKGQVTRLRTIFEQLGEKPTGKHCDGTEGCLKEVAEATEEDEEGALKDAGIIGASLRVEHYEIAGYTAAIAMAKALKEAEIVKLLTETLHEEEAAAKNILSGATSILQKAASQEAEEDDEDEGDEEKDPKKKESDEKSKQDEQEAAPELKNAPAPKSSKKTNK